MTKFSIKQATLCAALCLALPALAAQEEKPKTGGTLVYASLSGPGTLDPQVAASMVDLEVIHHLFEGLVAMDAHYNTKPLLAREVKVSDDQKTFTFLLRKGVKFHNGKTMTSADVKATFERYARVSPNKAVLDDVLKYDTPDDDTFVIELKKPNSVFLDVLKTPVYPFVILPAEQKDKPARGIDIIGTGVFKLGQWVKDSHLTIQRFADYVADDSASGPDGFAGKRTAYVDAVRFNFVPEANARVAAMQTGEAVFTSTVPPELAARLKSQKHLEEVTVYPYCQQYFIVNSQQQPTDKPQVRQAIRTAVHVDDIMKVIGASRKNHSMVYPDGAYYGGDVTNGRYNENDPKKARDLLKEAGYQDEPIVLQTNNNYDYMRDSILVLSEQLKKAGMNVKIDITDWTSNASNLQTGKGNWNVSTTSFCSNPILGPQQWQSMIYNFPHVKNDKVLDDAYETFYKTGDLEGRKKAWLDIEQRVLDQAYLIKVADRGNVQILNTRKVGGFEPYYMNHFWNVWLK
ncbi:peptide ABC transporter substrate-binding protein [Bordetella genomosp. 12]|uniref:Peptide ABC transporter substrate-binding protein n=1 Tax=Bordetella genomosp. 12 TaxID=463035 RepID=A0A261VM57_9BORD|nr:peptide ABC transporter substrate-binding protein [Bordetella genomosp. 12]